MPKKSEFFDPAEREKFAARGRRWPLLAAGLVFAAGVATAGARLGPAGVDFLTARAAQKSAETARAELVAGTFLPPSPLEAARAGAISAAQNWPEIVAATESAANPGQIFITEIAGSGATLRLRGEATHDRSYSLTAIAKFLAALRADPRFAEAKLTEVKKQNFADDSSSSPFEISAKIAPAKIADRSEIRGGEPLFDPTGTPPAAPAELAAETEIAGGVAKIALRWAGSGADFLVFGGDRAESLGLLAKTREPLFEKILPAGPAPYFFAVRAEGPGGALSPASAPLEVTPGDRAAPPAVENLAVRREPAEGFSGEAGFWVTLSWDPVAAADFEKYRIYRGETPDGLEILAETTEANFGFFTPRLGENYFRVVAVDRAGNQSR